MTAFINVHHTHYQNQFFIFKSPLTTGHTDHFTLGYYFCQSVQAYPDDTNPVFSLHLVTYMHTHSHRVSLATGRAFVSEKNRLINLLHSAVHHGVCISTTRWKSEHPDPTAQNNSLPHTLRGRGVESLPDRHRCTQRRVVNKQADVSNEEGGLMTQRGFGLFCD